MMLVGSDLGVVFGADVFYWLYARRRGIRRFFAYLLAASMLLVLAVNFVQMFVFWELVGLCSYLLIGYYFHKISASEAAKKAFITTELAISVFYQAFVLQIFELLIFSNWGLVRRRMWRKMVRCC